MSCQRQLDECLRGASLRAHLRAVISFDPRLFSNSFLKRYNRTQFQLFLILLEVFFGTKIDMKLFTYLNSMGSRQAKKPYTSIHSAHLRFFTFPLLLLKLFTTKRYIDTLSRNIHQFSNLCRYFIMLYSTIRN